MGTGKYDFPGIKKLGAKGLLLALASVPYVGIPLTTWPVVKDVVAGALEMFANWLANKGLVVLNLGAIAVEGDWNQKAFDSAIDEAFKKIQNAQGKLTPEQMKAIDDEVIKAARKLIVVTKHN